MAVTFVLFPARVGGLEWPEDLSFLYYNSFKNELTVKSIRFQEIIECLQPQLPHKLGLGIPELNESEIIQLAMSYSLIEFWKIEYKNNQVNITKVLLGRLHTILAESGNAQMELEYFNRYKSDYSLKIQSKLITINSSFGNATINDELRIVLQ